MVVVIALLLLVVLALAIRGCWDTRRDGALTEYNRSIATIVRESDTQVGEPFFQLLSGGGGESPQDLETAISAYGVTARQQLTQARRLEVPEEAVEAHRSALVALELRRNGLQAIAQRIRPALGDQGDTTDAAIAGIANQMGVFLASDVLWQARVTPMIAGALDDRDIRGQRPAATRNFLQGIEWLDEETVAGHLGRQLTGDEGAPGAHGTAIQSVSAGGVTLEEGAANRIPLAADALVVEFVNQGEHDESDVEVVVDIQPQDGDPIRLRSTIDTVPQGETVQATLPLESPPPAGQPVTITALVRAVPGEEMTDNNEMEFPALFTE